MAGSFRMDGDGVGATVRALTSHAVTASYSADSAEAALSDAEASVRSAQLSPAVAGFASRFTAQAAKVADHIDAVSDDVSSAATIFAQADEQMAADARALGPR